MASQMPSDSDFMHGTILGWVFEYACKFSNDLLAQGTRHKKLAEVLLQETRIGEARPVLATRGLLFRLDQHIHDLGQPSPAEHSKWEATMTLLDEVFGSFPIHQVDLQPIAPNLEELMRKLVVLVFFCSISTPRTPTDAQRAFEAHLSHLLSDPTPHMDFDADTDDVASALASVHFPSKITSDALNALSADFSAAQNKAVWLDKQRSCSAWEWNTLKQELSSRVNDLTNLLSPPSHPTSLEQFFAQQLMMDSDEFSTQSPTQASKPSRSQSQSQKQLQRQTRGSQKRPNTLISAAAVQSVLDPKSRRTVSGAKKTNATNSDSEDDNTIQPLNKRHRGNVGLSPKVTRTRDALRTSTSTLIETCGEDPLQDALSHIPTRSTPPAAPTSQPRARKGNKPADAPAKSLGAKAAANEKRSALPQKKSDSSSSDSSSSDSSSSDSSSSDSSSSDERPAKPQPKKTATLSKAQSSSSDSSSSDSSSSDSSSDSDDSKAKSNNKANNNNNNNNNKKANNNTNNKANNNNTKTNTTTQSKPGTNKSKPGTNKSKSSLMQPQPVAERIEFDSMTDSDDSSTPAKPAKLNLPAVSHKQHSPLVPKTSVTTVKHTPQGARGKRKPWTEEEIDNLHKGMERFGQQWATILAHYEFNGRTNIDLKDKWRNIKKTLE